MKLLHRTRRFHWKSVSSVVGSGCRAWWTAHRGCTPRLLPLFLVLASGGELTVWRLRRRGRGHSASARCCCALGPLAALLGRAGEAFPWRADNRRDARVGSALSSTRRSIVSATSSCCAMGWSAKISRLLSNSELLAGGRAHDRRALLWRRQPRRGCHQRQRPRRPADGPLRPTCQPSPAHRGGGPARCEPEPNHDPDLFPRAGLWAASASASASASALALAPLSPSPYPLVEVLDTIDAIEAVSQLKMLCAALWPCAARAALSARPTPRRTPRSSSSCCTVAARCDRCTAQ